MCCILYQCPVIPFPPTWFCNAQHISARKVLGWKDWFKSGDNPDSLRVRKQRNADSVYCSPNENCNWKIFFCKSKYATRQAKEWINQSTRSQFQLITKKEQNIVFKGPCPFVLIVNIETLKISLRPNMNEILCTKTSFACCLFFSLRVLEPQRKLRVFRVLNLTPIQSHCVLNF